MQWINIGNNTEIMQRPVLNWEFGNQGHPNTPVRKVLQQEAQEWAHTRNCRLPTAEEWKHGWPQMEHWGLLEWTSTVENDLVVVLGYSWNIESLFHEPSIYYFNSTEEDRYIGFRCVREKK